MKNKKILKISIILLIVLILFILFTIAYKFFIIKNLNTKLINIINTSNNYIMEIKNNNATGMSYAKICVLEDNTKIERQSFSFEEDNYLKWVYYSNTKENIMTKLNGETNSYTQEYIATESERKIINPYNLYFSNGGFTELFKTKITEIDYNNEECYMIQNSFYNYVIVDKDTGLLYEQSNGWSTKNDVNISNVSIYSYSFNKVEKDIFSN